MKQVSLIKIVVVCICVFGLAASVLAHSIPVHHDLEVTLYPQDQRLDGVDTLKLKASGNEKLLPIRSKVDDFGFPFLTTFARQRLGSLCHMRPFSGILSPKIPPTRKTPATASQA
jgi:hypothetical protein